MELFLSSREALSPADWLTQKTLKNTATMDQGDT